MAICGIRVRMDYFRGTGVAGALDDTSLNGAEFRCCPIPVLASNDLLPKCSNDHVTVLSTIKTSQPSTTLTTLSYTYGKKKTFNNPI